MSTLIITQSTGLDVFADAQRITACKNYHVKVEGFELRYTVEHQKGYSL